MNDVVLKPIKSTELKVDVQDVKFGMFIADLDVEWTTTRFAFKGFILETKGQMIELLQHCQWVIVDRDRSLPGTVPMNFTGSKPVDVPAKIAISPSIKIQENVAISLPMPAKSIPLVEASVNHQQDIKQANFLEPIGNLMQSVSSELNGFFSSLTGRRALKENYNPNKVHKNEALAIKQDFSKVTRAKQIKMQFKGDVADKIVNHVTTATIKEEVKKAAVVQNGLLAAATITLDNDFNGSGILDSINVAKDAISEVVDSVSRNPEAIQLVSSIKKLDSESYQHAIDAALMMVAFGRELCLSKDDLVEVGLGGLLHDVGEIKPPDNVSPIQRIRNITKFKIYKSHVEEGLKIVAGNNHSKIVKQIIENHHEFYDGTGYPKGRSKGQLGYYGNMMVIVDNYISFITGRNCDKPLSPSMALRVMYNQRGKKFHPVMLDTFIQLIGLFPVGSKVRLSTGDVGFVIKQNKERKLKPVVMVVENKRGDKLDKPVHIDLTEPVNGKEVSVIKELPIADNEMPADTYL